MMPKLMFLLMFYNFLSLTMGEYNPPKTAEYPFGDEVFNADLKEDRVQEEARELNVEIIKDISTFCSNVSADDEEQMLHEIPYVDYQCSKCDVRPTVGKTGVLVECYNCSDVSVLMTASADDLVSNYILFLTNYLEVRNYTAPDDSLTDT